MNHKKQNVLIVGGGMYVSGRGTKNYGTILPAILEAKKNGYINKVYVATTNPNSSKYVEKINVIMIVVKAEFAKSYKAKLKIFFINFKSYFIHN